MIEKNIEIGDILKLQEIDNLDVVIFEKVTEVTNPKCQESYFSTRTENLDFDFKNFYSIIDVFKADSLDAKWETLRNSKLDEKLKNWED